MRVLQVMECTIGGTRRHIVDVCAGLAQRGVDTHLVASTLRQADFADDLHALEACGVRVTRLPMVRELAPLQDARHLLALTRLIEREQPDIVHTHSSKAGALGRLASLAAGTGARVHTPHTYSFLFDAMFGSLKRRLYFDIERALAGSSQAVVAVGASEAQTIKKSGVCDPARVHTIPNGVRVQDLARQVPLTRSELGAPEGVPLLLVAGLLNVAKGQDLAIQALRAPALRAAHLLVVGHGPWEVDLRALAQRAGVAQRVHFLGWRSDLARIYGAVDWLLLPSRWEAMPYVVLEALACGTPVVATPVDGAREILTAATCGVLSPSTDLDALSSTLDNALRLPESTRLAYGRAGQRLVAEEYSVDRMLDRLQALYSQVLQVAA
jgi:glycosyltransferase involved in cell wall biosynthesis